MSIRNFYANQDIFITGGSGFVGKALIEKILRNFPNVGKVFVLIRSKKGKSATERLEELLNTLTFQRARKEQPQSFSKIFPIAGDCQELKLGISSEDLEKLKNVSVIFHSAASVRFDDHLKSAVLLNTRGTHELIKIAKTLKNLKAFIHISTSYANPDKHLVEEKIYPPYADWRTTIKLAETYDYDTLNVFFPKYSSHQPNTYTFTKSLAEQVVNDYRNELPLMILRPSIVISSIEEPSPGWVDNYNGPMGMLVACGVGLLRTNYGNPDNICDLIPVDVVVRSLLVAAYKLANDKAMRISNTNEVEVINCANSSINSITLGTVIEKGKTFIRENPFEKMFWLPEGSITRWATWHYIRFFTLQLGLALIIDSILFLAKQKPFFLKLQRRIHSSNVALYIFIITEWVFCIEKFKELDNLVPPEEHHILSFMHYSNIDQDEFLKNGIRGAKQYLRHEPREASARAKMVIKIMFFLHYFFKLCAVFLIGKYLIRYLQTYF